MKVRIEDTRSALHPSEIVVVVGTVSGSEALVVDRDSVIGDYLEVGLPLDIDGHKNVLVELPRETYSGAWRVWIPEGSLMSKAA